MGTTILSEMALIIATIIFFFYSLLFSTLFLSNKTPFLLVLISLIFFNDFFSVQLDYLFDGAFLYLLKAWKEILVLILALTTIYKFARNIPLNSFKIFKKIDFLIFLALLNFFFVAYAIIITRNSVFEAINESRSYYINLYIILLFCYNYDPLEINYRSVIRIVFLLVFINFAFASYNYFTFDGEYQSLWRYQFKIEREYAKLKEAMYGFKSISNDFVRGGNLRASGFLISTLEYGITLSFIFVISLISYLKIKVQNRGLLIVVMILCLVGIYTTQTRTAYGIVIMSFIIYFASVWFKKSFPLIVVPIFFIVLTFIAIAFKVPGVDEASSFGRVIQYLEFFKNFQLFGVGLGSSLRTTFDSFYLSVFTVYGVLGIFYLIIVFYPFNKIVSYFKSKENFIKSENGEVDVFDVLMISTMIFYSVSIFVLSIQYSVSSFQVFLLELLGFLMVYSKRLNRDLSAK